MRDHFERSSNKGGLSYLWAVALNYMTKRRGRFLTFVITFLSCLVARHLFSISPTDHIRSLRDWL